MEKLSVSEVLQRIQNTTTFHAEVAETGCILKIDEYLPVVCTAIHAGERLREDLVKHCLLTKEQRYFEEDPFTDDMISSQPITLVGLDSRFEYDLNRAMSLSTYYRSAWEQKVWDRPLPPKQRTNSQAKHAAFYQIYSVLIQKLESMFGLVIVFDIHSYNYKRIEKSTPVFNVGTSQVDSERWGKTATRFLQELGKIELPNIQVTAEENSVFEGRGYLIAHTNANFDRTLVLPTEVKKVFMEEESGTPYPLVLEALQSGLKEAFSQTSAYFQRIYNRKPKVSKTDMLSSAIDPAVLSVDRALYRLAHKVETLKYVTPTNIPSEKKRFFANAARYQPKYRYRQLPINANEFKFQLYRLPIENIADPDMRQLYSDMIDKLSEKVDLLTSVGQENFLYNSLAYHGRPDEAAVSNAKFLMYAKDISSAPSEIYSASEAAEQMKVAATNWGMKCKITLTSSLAARAMVSSVPPTLFVNKGATFTHEEVQRLIQHELGVHMATTYNAKQQALKIFQLGLPGSTFTQEGMAIMAEYKAGYMSLDRLKDLSTRVLAVDSMLKEHNFYNTYSYLVEELGIQKDAAFMTTTRVYRGGGFTKDYLYLTGFLSMLRAEEENNLNNLLIGKCSIKYLDLISEMVERDWLTPPKYRFDDKGGTLEPTLEYLINSLR
ncbi:flavohemoglobin expression-modulating QEGLA motif protein [Vibrio sp. 10N]|uniref:flavohemoglobin expression-modulating QEGLA motif protein n=1 Tax=Vibrio sp. 10N TaxID=3058938 RepID=UPI002812C60C|nr:flavohemoglobin expression-modulating QEGLA motif protein [Vibrio sp. 10N]